MKGSMKPCRRISTGRRPALFRTARRRGRKQREPWARRRHLPL